MKHPRFSIVIPTKNRPQLVPLAIDSVLRQSFPDFEAVVVDNNEDGCTAAALANIHDPRFRRIATGSLSMPDNWEAAVAASRGEYVCLLEDKQVLKRDSLVILNEIVEAWHPESVRWQTDALVDYGFGKRLRRGRRPVEQPTPMASADILRTFATESYSTSKRLLPLGHFTAISRRLIDRAMASPVGRLCPPMSPDYTAAFMQLALTDQILILPDALVAFSTVAVSNGANIRRKHNGAAALARELGRDTSGFYDLVPIKAVTVANSIYNDFLHVREKLGGRLREVDLDLPVYFRECFESFGHSVALGADVAEEMATWRGTLLRQEPAIREKALALIGVRSADDALASLRARYRQRSGQRLREILGGIWRRYVRRNPSFQFDSIDEFLEWDAKQHVCHSQYPCA